MGNRIRQADNGRAGQQPLGRIVRVRTAYDPGHGQNEGEVWAGAVRDAGDGAGEDQGKASGQNAKSGVERLTEISTRG